MSNLSWFLVTRVWLLLGASENLQPPRPVLDSSAIDSFDITVLNYSTYSKNKISALLFQYFWSGHVFILKQS